VIDVAVQAVVILSANLTLSQLLLQDSNDFDLFIKLGLQFADLIIGVIKLTLEVFHSIKAVVILALQLVALLELAS